MTFKPVNYYIVIVGCHLYEKVWSEMVWGDVPMGLWSEYDKNLMVILAEICKIGFAWSCLTIPFVTVWLFNSHNFWPFLTKLWLDKVGIFQKAVFCE